MLKCLSVLWACIASGALLVSCSSDIDVFTDAKEAYVVYGILNPALESQYFKISRVFQTSGDAYFFAAENDPTTRGLLVSLEMDTSIWTASEIYSLPRDSGLFIPGQVIYGIPLKGSLLVPGKTYTLHIRKPDDPLFLVTASTIFPEKPVIKSPKGPYTGAGGIFVWPSIDFERNQTIEFEKGNSPSWELRAGFYFQRNGQPGHATWKKAGLILPEDNCFSVNSADICFPIPPGGFPRFILSQTSASSVPLVYTEVPYVAHSIDSLPRVCFLEITALDQQLTTFLYANDPGPFGINLLMDKQEFSNISGDNYGIFGAINTDTSWVYMGQCTQFLGGLTSASPPDCSF